MLAWVPMNDASTKVNGRTNEEALKCKRGCLCGCACESLHIQAPNQNYKVLGMAMRLDSRTLE